MQPRCYSSGKETGWPPSVPGRASQLHGSSDNNVVLALCFSIGQYIVPYLSGRVKILHSCMFGVWGVPGKCDIVQITFLCEHLTKRPDAGGGVRWLSSSLKPILSLRIVILVGCCVFFFVLWRVLRERDRLTVLMPSVHGCAEEWTS